MGSLSEMGGGGGEDEEEGEESDSTSGLLSEERPRAVISRKSASRLADARSRERTTASRASRALKTRAGRSDGSIGSGGSGGGGRNRLMTASPDRVHDIVRQRSKSPASLSPTVSDPPKSARGLLAVAAQVSHKHSESLGGLEGGAGTPKRRSRVRSSRSTRSLSRRRSGMKRRKQSLGVIRSSSHLAVPGRRSSASLAPPVEVGDLDAVLASSPELVEADFAGVGLNRSFSASALDR